MAERPFLSAAFLCEKVLQEKDEVLTAVRIVDMLFVSIPANMPSDAKPMIQATALVAFKKASPGTEAEMHQVALRVCTPSGRQLPPLMADIVFKPVDQLSGFNLIGNLNIGVEEFGLFWLDVLLDNELMTRIPFRLLEKLENPPKTIH